MSSSSSSLSKLELKLLEECSFRTFEGDVTWTGKL